MSSTLMIYSYQSNVNAMTTIINPLTGKNIKTNGNVAKQLLLLHKAKIIKLPRSFVSYVNASVGKLKTLKGGAPSLDQFIDMFNTLDEYMKSKIIDYVSHLKNNVFSSIEEFNSFYSKITGVPELISAFNNSVKEAGNSWHSTYEACSKTFGNIPLNVILELDKDSIVFKNLMKVVNYNSSDPAVKLILNFLNQHVARYYSENAFHNRVLWITPEDKQGLLRYIPNGEEQHMDFIVDYLNRILLYKCLNEPFGNKMNIFLGMTQFANYEGSSEDQASYHEFFSALVNFQSPTVSVHDVLMMVSEEGLSFADDDGNFDLLYPKFIVEDGVDNEAIEEEIDNRIQRGLVNENQRQQQVTELANEATFINNIITQSLPVNQQTSPIIESIRNKLNYIENGVLKDHNEFVSYAYIRSIYVNLKAGLITLNLEVLSYIDQAFTPIRTMADLVNLVVNIPIYLKIFMIRYPSKNLNT